MVTDESYRGALVTTAWVQRHLTDPYLMLVEVDADIETYQRGHIPGAVGWDRVSQLSNPPGRDILSKGQVEQLLGESGIDNYTTIVLYGDTGNAFAAYAFWQLKMYGHGDLKLMDGGLQRWAREGRPLTTTIPRLVPKAYRASPPDVSIRALQSYVLDIATTTNSVALVDVRTPEEFRGELVARHRGHIPRARNIPWDMAINGEEGSFKSAHELGRLYASRGVTPEREIITYCHTGERAAHTWFVLAQLLDYPKVRCYDGSWAEYQELVGVPVER